jgi:hypothetical protein
MAARVRRAGSRSMFRSGHEGGAVGTARDGWQDCCWASAWRSHPARPRRKPARLTWSSSTPPATPNRSSTPGSWERSARSQHASSCSRVAGRLHAGDCRMPPGSCTSRATMAGTVFAHCTSVLLLLPPLPLLARGAAALLLAAPPAAGRTGRRWAASSAEADSGWSADCTNVASQGCQASFLRCSSRTSCSMLREASPSHP